MKKTILFLLAAVNIIALSSCDREDLAAHKMSRGKGRWNVKEINYTTYDTAGNVISTTTKVDSTQIQFYSTSTYDALYGYYACMIIQRDTLGNAVATPEQFMSDKDRINVTGSSLLGGWWTVVGFGGAKQVWIRIKTRSTSYKNSSLESKYEVVLKRD